MTSPTLSRPTECGPAVGRLLGEQEVAGSIPVIPTFVVVIWVMSKRIITVVHPTGEATSQTRFYHHAAGISKELAENKARAVFDEYYKPNKLIDWKVLDIDVIEDAPGHFMINEDIKIEFSDTHTAGGFVGWTTRLWVENPHYEFDDFLKKWKKVNCS